MIRATTGGVLKSYRNNLMNSFISKNNAMTTILTQRNFNSYAEDPAAAAKAFRLRKARMTVDSQYSVCNDTYKKFQTGFSCLDGIDKLLDTDTGAALNTLKGTTLEMLNDPTGDAREQLTTVLDQISEAIVQDLNQKYGETFIFAGADGHNVPFEVKDNKLYYRGVPVDAAIPQLMQDNGADVKIGNDYVLANATTVQVYPDLQDDGTGTNTPLTVAVDGKPYYVADGAPSYNDIADIPAGENPVDYIEVNDANGTKIYKASDLIDQGKYDSTMASAVKDANGDPAEVTINGKSYYVMEGGTMTEEEYATACKDAEKLKYLMNEKQFIDIGLGFQENNGKLIETSAFNAALNGLTFIGYGVDADGDPKNIYSIVQKLKDIGARVQDGQNWSNADYDEFYGLVQKLETASSNFKTEYTNMSAGTEKLKNNVELLEDNAYNLEVQYSDLEDVDMVDAISSFLWAEYAYNAALKVGTSILSESLMDYLS